MHPKSYTLLHFKRTYILDIAIFYQEHFLNVNIRIQSGKQNNFTSHERNWKIMHPVFPGPSPIQSNWHKFASLSRFLSPLNSSSETIKGTKNYCPSKIQNQPRVQNIWLFGAILLPSNTIQIKKNGAFYLWITFPRPCRGEYCTIYLHYRLFPPSGGILAPKYYGDWNQWAWHYSSFSHPLRIWLHYLPLSLVISGTFQKQIGCFLNNIKI